MAVKRQGTAEPISALNRVRLEESGEPLVDLHVACPGVRVKDDMALPFVREMVAHMLNQAIDELPDGHGLLVFRALRTIEMQKQHWDRYYQELKNTHPAWPNATLRRATNRYFAPYDQPAPPGHCTGGAVDVALLTPDGVPKDVLPPLGDWSLGHTDSSKVTLEVREYRTLLLVAMLSVGFSNCRDEYWHYSYGDAAWAVRTRRNACVYGLATPPDVEYE